MATDPRKRQKKLEKKRAKRKDKHHQLVKQKNLGLAENLKQAASAPILHCWSSGVLFEEGMGQVILSRELPDGGVAVAVFLVDMYCLGVKDAFGTIVSRYEYDSRFRSPRLLHNAENLEPATARKLVEGAVEYAKSIGFSPHPDYQKARVLFGDIDPNLSLEEFEFGDLGKPHFIAGPEDNPTRCRFILSVLNNTCGQGRYLVTIPPQAGFSLKMLEE